VEATMSNAALDALERLYVNVRPEYPFGVRDWELVKDYLERAERERDAGNEKHLVLWQRWQDAERQRDAFHDTVSVYQAELTVALDQARAAEARAQKAEAVVEAARNWVQIAENHTTPFAVPEPERLRAALTAYDEPPTLRESLEQADRDLAVGEARPASEVFADLVDEPPTEQIPGAGQDGC
jgi:hypothetical protein